MKKIIITFLILVTSCGYQPLYLNKDPNKLIFKEIKLLGDKNINRQIISTISIKEDKENFTFEKVTLKNRENIIETSKDSKGQPVSFKMIIILDFEIGNKGNIIKQKTFVKEFSYKNQENKFDLSEYEIDLRNNLTNQIIEELNIFLNI